MLEDIVNNLANHLATGQIPKPYRRGSWRPIGHMRPSSPLLDSVRDLFEGYDQISKDFNTAFYGNAKLLCDVVFNVMGSPINGGNENQVRRIYAVRAILAIRSRVFLEMLYGFAPPGRGSISGPPPELQAANSAGTSSSSPPLAQLAQQIHNTSQPSSKSSSKSSSKASSKRGSITAETKNMIAQLPKIIQPSESKEKKEKDSRKASAVSTASSTSPSGQKTPTYLTVPGASGGGVFKNAFSRLVSGSWSGWGSKGRQESMKRWQSESIYAKMEQSAAGVEVPGLSVCADVAKIDRNKLAQNEVHVIGLFSLT